MDININTREDKLFGGFPDRDFIYNNRLFRCVGNSVFRLLVFFLLLFLFDNYKKSEIYQVDI
jgi:hypothetical protein